MTCAAAVGLKVHATHAALLGALSLASPCGHAPNHPHSQQAGMDQEGGGTSAIDQLPEALAEKMVTAADIQLAFRRLFRSRIRLGMV